jgi:signal transduction histidine kinase
MKQFFLIWLCICPLLEICQAQQIPDLAGIKKMKDDSAKVNRLNESAEKTLSYDPLLAISILDNSIQLSQKIKYPLGGSIALGIRATMFIYEMKLDSAGFLLDKAFSLVKNETNDSYISQQAALYQKYGSILQQKQLYDSAIKRYLLAAELYKNVGHEDQAIIGFYNIALMYGLLDEPGKALLYAREVHRIAVKTKNAEFLLRSYIALGDAFTATKQFDSVLYYAQTGLAKTDVNNNPFVNGKFQQLKGIYFLKAKSDYKTALLAFAAALKNFEKINLPYEKAMLYQNMSNAYLQDKDYDNAIRFGTSALELTQSLGLYELEVKALTDLALAAEYSGQVDKAYRYLRQYTLMKDTLEQLNKRKLVNELEARYQSQKKEALLLSQQNIIYKKNVLNYILIGSAFTILLISLLGYYSYRQKQKLQQQRINELETQHQLFATEAVLKGEEQERTRLAKDLHDGLGGMLSGIKYSFNNMKGNMVMTEENRQAFDRSMDMLDSSINEMRRVAHNMMPEVLLKFGLDTALKDFCNDINKVALLKISYQSIGLKEAVVPQTMAITIYRIVQELISNSLKHASATNAIVQVSLEDQHLSLTVEDDGKGFDKMLLKRSAGMGWSNIEKRVEFLKGKMDIQSEKDKGTSVHIEISIA